MFPTKQACVVSACVITVFKGPKDSYRPPGGSSISSYKMYEYVRPQKIWFLSCFSHKEGMDFDHIGLKLGILLSMF